MEFRGEPVFAKRGVMLDVSRCRVPTMEHLREVVGVLKKLRFNHLQLYTEHTFAYAGHETFWQGWSPITPDELRELDGWCDEAGIELAANQNCFGHLYHVLKHDRYLPLAESPEGWIGWGTFRPGPWSICPTDPGSLVLIDDWLGQLLGCLKSNLINIGCDETYDVGQGRSKAIAETRGKTDVYVDFVNEVAQVAQRHGGIPMFWADIVLENPETLKELDPALIALAWGYEADSPFARWGEALSSADREWWVCPGTSTWNSFLGRGWARRENLASAARDGLKYGASGYLATNWGDSGHRQQWPIELIALAESAHVAWHGSGEGYDPGAAGRLLFDNEPLGRWLDAVSDIEAGLAAVGGRPDKTGNPTPVVNDAPAFQDLHHAYDPQSRPVTADPSLWAEAKAKLEESVNALPAIADPRVAAEVNHAIFCEAFALDHAIARRSYPGRMPKQIRYELSVIAERITTEHRRLWRGRSRRGGMDESSEEYEKIIRRLRLKSHQLEAEASG